MVADRKALWQDESVMLLCENPSAGYGTVPSTGGLSTPATPAPTRQVLPMTSSCTPASAFDDVPSTAPLESVLMCVKRLTVIGAPSCATVALWYGAQFLSAVVVGHSLGTNELAAVSVGYYSFCFCTLYFGMGMAFAVDTICAQEYGRDPESTVQGEVCQRSLLVSTLLLIPMTLLALNSEPILRYLYDAGFAAQVAQWHRWGTLYLATQLYTISLGKFLNNQLKPHLPMIASALATASVYPITEYVINVLQMGVGGVSLAMGIASSLQLAAVVLLLVWDAAARRRFGPILSVSELLCAKKLVPFLRLGIYSAIFVAGEAAAFDFIVLFSGTLGELEAAAWSAIQSTMLLSQSTSAGISVSASTLVGMAVGSGNVPLAKRYVVIAPVMAALLSLFASGIVVSWHASVFAVVTPDPRVHRTIESILWLIPIYHLLDCVQFVFQGIFSGCGRNRAGSMVLVAALWGIGMPLAVYGARRGGLLWEVAGFSLGMAVELPLFICVILFSFDWKPLFGEEEAV